MRATRTPSVHRPTHDKPAPRLSDRDLLERVDPIYEHACWLADCDMVDFWPFAELADVLRELRLRVAS